MTDPIELERPIAANPARVFAAFRDPRDLERWAWGSLGEDCRAEIDFRVGGAFTVSTRREDGSRWAMLGEYTAIEPDRLVAHTLRWDAPMGYGPVEERITVELLPAGPGTLVRFRHEGDFGEAARKGHLAGWGNVLDALQARVEPA